MSRNYVPHFPYFPQLSHAFRIHFILWDSIGQSLKYHLFQGPIQTNVPWCIAFYTHIRISERSRCTKRSIYAVFSKEGVYHMGVKFLKEHRFRTHQGHPGFFPLLTPWAWTPSTDVTQHPSLSFSHGDGGLWNIPSKNISVPIPVGVLAEASRRWCEKMKIPACHRQMLGQQRWSRLGTGASHAKHGHPNTSESQRTWPHASCLFLDCQACNGRVAACSKCKSSLGSVRFAHVHFSPFGFAIAASALALPANFFILQFARSARFVLSCRQMI